MSEITQCLAKARAGDAEALDRVYELVYPHLKRMAAAHLARLRPGDTFTPTALVNEAYVRLHRGADIDLVDRRHLAACFARAIRYILVDHARARSAAKRGGGLASVTLSEANAQDVPARADLLDIDRALDALGEVNGALRDLVELRFFGGLGEAEIAELKGTSTRTVRREWRRARAFLHERLSE